MRRTAVLLVVGLLAAGCATDRRSAPVPCAVTPVHHGRVPAAVPGFTPRATDMTWLGGGEFVAVLFYSRGGSPDIPVGGFWPHTEHTAKILWWAADATADLHVHGSEATTARQFDQTAPTVGGGQYPSVVNVPAPGCWTLAETVAGHPVGSITVRAVG